MKRGKLPPEALRKTKAPESWKIEDTREISLGRGRRGPMGQERAVEAMELALAVDAKGYNVFLSGPPGSGRTSYALARLRALARSLPAPCDWLYLHDFDAPSRPLAVSVPAGAGKQLASALDALVEDLKAALGKAFEQSQYEDAKARHVKAFQEAAGAIMEELRATAAEHQFVLKHTPQGFLNVPLIEVEDEDGKKTVREMEQEEFDALGADEHRRYQELSEQIMQRTVLGLRKIRDMEKDLKEKVSELERQICRAAIAPSLAEALGPYQGDEALSRWADRMAEDVIQNFGAFVEAARDADADPDFSRYRANLFVSNDPKGGAPVVWETSPTWYNLVGKVEHEGRQGYLWTDFHHIVPGAFHRANGGFLVLDAEKVLMAPMSWEALKRVLRTEEAAIEDLGDQYAAIPVSSLRPEPIKMALKVVLVGSPLVHEMLCRHDPEFRKLFKIEARFDVDMPREARTERLLARVVADIVDREGLLPFDATALSEIVEQASRRAEDQALLSVEMGPLRELVMEADAWARVGGERARVARAHVKKAIDRQRHRSSLYQEKLDRAFEDGIIRVDVTGTAVGQINGLSVVELTGHRFGHPSRITANVFMGQEGVVNIEREVRMAGPIHNKGLMTLSSYLGRMYAQDMPLTLSARLAFEQSYAGIEGDSASSTELYCLLSALSGLPLRQDVAVTGSVDQFGNVQPIGGVNEKIEGFFRYCRIAGPTAGQGVMIPSANVRHLMLDDEVVEAVRAGQFSVWAVSSIDEGIELLTGVKAGRARKGGGWTEGSVHARVKARLTEMHRASLKDERPKRRRSSRRDEEEER